jgi:lincosamide nucleotidyltransferase A/C/D/E
MPMKTLMASEDVLVVVELLEHAHITVWIDGGWGVDALLGTETRHHADLDLAIALSDVTAATDLLRQLGYVEVTDQMPTRLELGDDQDHRVDFHPLVFDEQRNGCQQLPNGGNAIYTASGLAAIGSIAGHPVRCLSPKLQLRFHLGYDPEDADRHDVAQLCRHFSLPLPDPYR